MILSRNGLKVLLMNQVAEIKFRRRHDKPGWASTRRILCTNNEGLLKGVKGRTVFNFVTPTGKLKYSPDAKNLVITYDLFMQDWRAIDAGTADVISTIDVSKDQSEFWDYFNKRIYPMTRNQKKGFMNK